jgi:NAD(P)-dependent dehydrogenase (short-subunit alcohol dehydrogenase family)
VSGARGVLVTGGTGALGRAIVKRLLEQGARVAVTYRREAEWRTLESAAAAPGRLHGVEADLADAEAARRAVEKAAAELGVLDGLALVAGGWAGGTAFDAAPADEWSRMLRGNLDSAAYACRHALPLLRKQGGAIVAVGSRAAERPAAQTWRPMPSPSRRSTRSCACWRSRTAAACASTPCCRGRSTPRRTATP